jgi:bile acid:Na+ symporter, BASS family
MRVFHFIENYFWVFLLAGIALGLSYPVYNDFFMSLLKPLLMLMLLLVFLKTNLVQILTQIRDYRLMLYLLCLYMFIIPLALFAGINFINREFAIGILLLTAMPAAVSSPTLTDIVKGNIALSASIAIITSLVAPFTVPVIFMLVKYEGLSINSLEMFTDLAILVFVPLVLSIIIRRIGPGLVEKGENKFTSVNILIIFIMVYAAMGSQRELILTDTLNVFWKVGYMYLVYLILHIIGYFIGKRLDKPGQIAVTISTVYKNNGMAIVLAAIHFEPAILVLMILSEFPWNTLLAPYRRALRYL